MRIIPFPTPYIPSRVAVNLREAATLKEFVHQTQKAQNQARASKHPQAQAVVSHKQAQIDEAETAFQNLILSVNLAPIKPKTTR